jgi:hypothetical protein
VPGSTDISVATTWAATPAPCDVVVTRDLYINAPLTVEAGAQVCFQPNTGLLVQENGTLTAVGTADAPISFVGTVPAAGSWKGVSVASLSGTGVSRFAHVTFQHAGNAAPLCCANFIDDEDITGALLVGDKVADSRASVEDCTFKDVGGHGLFVFPAASLAGFARNTFQGVALAPVAVPLQAAGMLDGATVYSGPVRVLDSDVLESPLTLRALPVPYGMSTGVAGKTFRLQAKLTVEAGARLEFEAGGALVVDKVGRLEVNGTADKRVTFTGRTQTPGFWKGIALVSLGNRLTYADVTHGGAEEVICCDFYDDNNVDARANLVVGDRLETASVTLSNVRSTHSGGSGVTVLSQSTVTQSGTNDLVSSNAAANVGL